MFSFSGSIASKKAFTLVELIVVITILAILAAVGFVIMSHQTSVARDGKRISEIQSLSSASRITTAQLRELPRPIADSLELTVSGSFIGYQGFMSTALVNPLGYGSDKIYDPLDGTPYTYRVNQHYDSAQFMAYLENPRFERSIEIASQSLPSVVSKAYALDTSSIDFSKRYPYAIGDRLGIFIDKNTRTPLQSGITGTGSRDISLSDASTLDIIVGSQGADEYVSTDISTGALSSLKDGSFGEKSLLGMNGGSSGSGDTGSGGGEGNNGGSLSGYVLTMGEYTLLGQPMYGYVGPGFASGPYASYITTITAGDLTPKTIDGKVIDSIFFLQGQQYILLENNNGIPNVVVSEGSQNSNCINGGVIGSIQLFGCESVSIVGPYTVGEMRSLRIVIPPSLPAPNNVIDAPLNTEIISNVVSASNISSPVNISVTNGDLRINGGSWVTSGQITSNGDQVEYRTQVTQEGERKLVAINLNGINSQWVVDAYSCFYYSQESYGDIRINGYKIGCSENVVIPSVLFGGNVTEIHYDAFRNSPITSIIISEGIKYIGDDAFRESQLISVSLPSTLIGIGDRAFQDAQLTSVNIPYGITRIRWDSFRGNNLTSVTIPNSVTIIETSAFQNNQLTSVTIPDSVDTIGWYSFYDNNLTSITIPNSVSLIGYSAFTSQINALGNGTVYGPSSGYVKDTYINDFDSDYFDKIKLPNYVNLP